MQVHRRIDELKAAGADVIVIGNGAPMFIAGFREHTGWAGPLYTDPTLEAYRAAHLERGVLKTLDPRGMGSLARALVRGHRQGRTQGDEYQQGGALVIDRDGNVVWQHISRRPGDLASVDDMLAAVRRVG